MLYQGQHRTISDCSSRQTLAARCIAMDGAEVTPRRSGRLKRVRPVDVFDPSEFSSTPKSRTRAARNPVHTPVSRQTKASVSSGTPNSARASSSRQSQSDSFGRLIGDGEEAHRAKGSLFDVVVDVKAAIKPSIQQWKRRFASRPQDGIAEVITFIVHCCGSTDHVTTNVLNQNVKTVVRKLHKAASESTAAYPLVNREGGMKKFHIRLDQTIDFIVKSIENDILDVDVNSDHHSVSLITTMIEWCSVMSTCSSRAFRHTSTYIGFSILASLLAIENAERRQSVVRSRQLQSELSKGKGKGKSSSTKGKICRESNAAKVAQLKRDLDELQSRRSKAESYIARLFDQIFVNRYRDIWAQIRLLCLDKLGEWILHSPSFVADKYLKYIGWSLYSQESSIRLLAIRIVQRQVENDAIRPALEAFLQRFVPRIIEMQHDVDNGVCSAAVDCCTSLLTQNDVMSTRDEFGEVAPLIWDNCVNIRVAAAKHIYEDTFVVEQASDDPKVAMLEDIDQLYTLYAECAPTQMTATRFENEDTDEQIVVEILVDAFFFKLNCLRDFDLLCTAIMEDEDITSNNKYSPEILEARQRFFARCMLAVARFVFGKMEIDSCHGKRLSKPHQAIVDETRASFNGFVEGQSFFHLISTFQNDGVVLLSLCRVVCLCKGAGKGLAPCLVTIFEKIGDRQTLDAVAAAIKHVGGSQEIHDVSVSLVKQFSALKTVDNNDIDAKRLSLCVCTARLRALCSQSYVHSLVESNSFDHDLALMCATQLGDRAGEIIPDQVLILGDLLAITVFNTLWLVRQVIEMEETSQDRASLSKLMDVRLVVLSQALEAALFPSSPLHIGACDAVATLSTLAASVSSCRHGLSSVAYERYYEVVRQALIEIWEHRNHKRHTVYKQSHSILASAIPVSICQGQERVAAFVLAYGGILARDDDSMDRTIALEAAKEVMSFYRARQMFQQLAVAQLWALEFTFERVVSSEDRQLNMSYVRDMARRLSLSYGSLTQHCFDDVIISGIDYASSNPDYAEFADVALPFFAHRLSAVQAGKSAKHLSQTLRALSLHSRDGPVPDFDRLNQTLKKRLKAVSKHRLEKVQEESNTEQYCEEVNSSANSPETGALFDDSQADSCNGQNDDQIASSVEHSDDAEDAEGSMMSSDEDGDGAESVGL